MRETVFSFGRKLTNANCRACLPCRMKSLVQLLTRSRSSWPFRFPPTNNATQGYDLYLQGLYFSNKGNEEDLRKALSFFQRSLEKDPTFSRAWTGISKVWYFLADVYVKPLAAYPISKEA